MAQPRARKTVRDVLLPLLLLLLPVYGARMPFARRWPAHAHHMHGMHVPRVLAEHSSAPCLPVTVAQGTIDAYHPTRTCAQPCRPIRLPGCSATQLPCQPDDRMPRCFLCCHHLVSPCIQAQLDGLFGLCGEVDTLQLFTNPCVTDAAHCCTAIARAEHRRSKLPRMPSWRRQLHSCDRKWRFERERGRGGMCVCVRVCACRYVRVGAWDWLADRGVYALAFVLIVSRTELR